MILYITGVFWFHGWRRLGELFLSKLNLIIQFWLEKLHLLKLRVTKTWMIRAIGMEKVWPASKSEMKIFS